MKDSDLRHLRRSDLLALLEELSRENDRLREELAATKEELKSQQVSLSECGSLAEAAMKISGVFEAADRARDTYLELVKQNHPVGGAAGGTDTSEGIGAEMQSEVERS